MKTKLFWFFVFIYEIRASCAGTLTKTASPEITAIAYSNSGSGTAPFGVAEDIVFENSDKVNCPVTACTLEKAGCTGTPAKTSIDPTTFTISGIETDPSGWTESVCITCTNAGGSVAYDNVDFTAKPDCMATGSKKAAPTPPDLAYSAGNASPDFGPAPTLFFENSKPTLCPWLMCMVKAAGCMMNPAKVTIGAAPTFTLSGDQTVSNGWQEAICVICVNGGG